MSSAISTSNPVTLFGSAGSASTKGVPPSGSPAHFNSAGWASREKAKGKREKAASVEKSRRVLATLLFTIVPPDGGRRRRQMPAANRRRDAGEDAPSAIGR